MYNKHVCAYMCIYISPVPKGKSYLIAKHDSMLTKHGAEGTQDCVLKCWQHPTTDAYRAMAVNELKCNSL